MNKTKLSLMVSVLFVFIFLLTPVKTVKAVGWVYYEDATIDTPTGEDIRESYDASYYSYARENEYGGYGLPADPNNPWGDMYLSYEADTEVEVWTANEYTQGSTSVAGTGVSGCQVYHCWVWEGGGYPPGGDMEYNYTVHSGCTQMCNGGYYINPASVMLSAGSTPQSWQYPGDLYRNHTTHSSVNYLSNSDPLCSYHGPGRDSVNEYYNGNSWVYEWYYYLDVEDEVEVDAGEILVGLLFDISVNSSASAAIGQNNSAWGLSEYYSEIYGEITSFVSN